MTSELTPGERALLDLLASDAREPVASLARKLGISRTTVQERIRRLEEKGVIAGYTIVRGEHARKPKVVAHTTLRIEPKRLEAVVAALRKESAVRSVYALSGDFDALVVLEADRTEELDRAIDALGRIDGVERTQTSMVLSVKFERR